MRTLADRATRLADFLDDEGRHALANAARNIATELEAVAASMNPPARLRRVA